MNEQIVILTCQKSECYIETKGKDGKNLIPTTIELNPASAFRYAPLKYIALKLYGQGHHTPHTKVNKPDAQCCGSFISVK